MKKKYKFKASVINNSMYQAYYKRYAGHEFIKIPYDSYEQQQGHCKLQCISNPELDVTMYIFHTEDLEVINGN